jgi:hypothetical protein
MDNVSSSLGFSASSDPKTAVMNQVRQEAAMTNARQLIEACFSLFLSRTLSLSLPILIS